MKRTLSVVICTYNRLDCLAESIGSVRAQVAQRSDVELIVINDGSTDGTTEWLSAPERVWTANTRILNQPNQGLSAARNRGWQEASGDWIAYLDDDAIASDNWTGDLLAACATVETKIGVIGGPIRLRWRQPAPAWLSPQLEEWLTSYQPTNYAETSVDRPLFRGANMTCRRTALARIGGFSLELGRKAGSLLSREECDLADRMRVAEYAFRFEPAPWVWHQVHPERLRRAWFCRRLYWEGVSLQRAAIHDRPASPLRRKARAALYAGKKLLQPRAWFRALAFFDTRRQMSAWAELSFHWGAARGLWASPRVSIK